MYSGVDTTILDRAWETGFSLTGFALRSFPIKLGSTARVSRRIPESEFIARSPVPGLFRKANTFFGSVSECAVLCSYNGSCSDFTERNETMKEAPLAKKRANPRFDFFADAEMTLSNGTSVLGQLSELSAKGCCITTLRSIPILAEVRLRLSDGVSSCEVSGKVIYVNVGGGLGIFGIGVVFGEMSVGGHSTIDKWLRDLARRRIRRQS